MKYGSYLRTVLLNSCYNTVTLRNPLDLQLQPCPLMWTLRFLGCHMHPVVISVKSPDSRTFELILCQFFVHFVFICIRLNLYTCIIDISFNHYENSTICPLWYLLYDVDIADYWVSATFSGLQLVTLLKNKITVLKCFGAHVLIFIFFPKYLDNCLGICPILFSFNESSPISHDNCLWCKCLIFRFTKISW